MAQPSKLTEHVKQTLCRAVGLGAPLNHACKAAGVTYACLWEWEQKAKEGKQPYADLFEALEKAEGERTMRWLAHIEKAAAEGNWTASAWKLERLAGPEFQRKDQLQIQVSVAEMSDEELDAYIDAASHKRPRITAGGERKAS